jgi:hypothetical protein
MVDIPFQSGILGALENRTRNLVAGCTRNAELSLQLGHLCVDPPHPFMQVSHRLELQSTVTFTYVPSNMDKARQLDRIATFNLVVKELVWVWIRCRDTCPTPEPEIDTDPTMRSSIQL